MPTVDSDTDDDCSLQAESWTWLDWADGQGLLRAILH